MSDEIRQDHPESAGQKSGPDAPLYQGCSKEDTQAWLDKTEAEAARIAEAAVMELERSHQRVYLLMGMVYGLLMALYLVLLFQRREA